MAKKSSIEKNNRRRRMAKKYSGRRARLKAIARDKTKPVEVCRDAEARRVAAQFLGDAGSQPLRADGPAARLLPQAQIVAHRAAGARLQGADPRIVEVELVRRRARCQ